MLLQRCAICLRLRSGGFVRHMASFFDANEKGSHYTEKTFPKDLLEMSYWEMFRRGLRHIRPEFRKLRQEIKYTINPDQYHLFTQQHGDYQIFFTFNDENSIKEWHTTSDAVMDEGFSTSKLNLNQNGFGLFSGNLCTKVPKGSLAKRTGYATIRSPSLYKSGFRLKPYEIDRYTHMVVRCRGDGRGYGIIAQIESEFDVGFFDQYIWNIFTHGGPYWQTCKIPLNKFYFSHKGRIQDNQEPVALPHGHRKIKWFAITVSDNCEGPFALELDYIGFVTDKNQKTHHDYELYSYDPKLYGALS